MRGQGLHFFSLNDDRQKTYPSSSEEQDAFRVMHESLPLSQLRDILEPSTHFAVQFIIFASTHWTMATRNNVSSKNFMIPFQESTTARVPLVFTGDVNNVVRRWLTFRMFPVFSVNIARKHFVWNSEPDCKISLFFNCLVGTTKENSSFSCK